MTAPHEEGNPPDESGPPQSYETLKALAKQRGIPVTELLALARANDPFYSGTPAQRKAAEWFADLFAAGRFGHGVHLRRIHYFGVSTEARMPSGMPYVNTVECADVLGEASKAARYLGLVDVAAFDDRRNPQAIVYEADRTEARFGVSDSDLEVRISIGNMPRLPEIWVTRPAVVQPFALEIWCEKSTMNDVLVPLCAQLEATLVTGMGELSITACKRLVERVRRDRRPARILYVSDFDPAGQSMPVAVARKIEFLSQGMGLDIALLPVVLTAEQVEQYKLPRVPIKESELRRERFERVHGIGATELDALEALHPGVLRKILRAAAAPYRDEQAEERIVRKWLDLRAEAANATARVHAQFAEKIEQARAEWAALGEAYDEWWEGNIAVWREMAAALETVDLDLSVYPVPCAPGDVELPMFSTLRAYEVQLAAYRAFREGRLGAPFEAIKGCAP